VLKEVMATVRQLTSLRQHQDGQHQDGQHPGGLAPGPPAHRFDKLFLEQYPRVVLIAYRVLGDRHAAEDVAQEVFLSFHGRVDPAAEWAPSWLWAASVHRALNMARGTRRRMHRELLAPVAGSEPEPEDPEEKAIAAEQRTTVRAALTRLPERQAEVLVLWACGLSYADIATAVGAQPTSVGTLVCRAQRALRKELTNVETPL
jgi:RNA polymerase sigma factor (sigma-70 family)